MTLEEARKKRNMSQVELAKAADITQTQLSLIENGRAMPHPKTKKNIEEKLGLKVDWIATRIGGSLTKGGMWDSDGADGIISSIAIYIQSGQVKDREERFRFLHDFLDQYEKKLKADLANKDQQIKRQKKK